MAGVALIDWDAPGPYRVAFSTREGGVSEGAYASLNLGIRTEDDPAAVVENRRRLCEAVGADADAATMAWQRHGATVTRAQSRGIVTPGTVYDHCDGLWSDERGRAMLLITADCVPVAIARRPEPGVRPAVAVLHVGWRGLLAGIVGEGVRAIGPGKLAAVVGPAIGPCCYEVGEEVLEAFADLDGVADERMLDLRTVVERKLEDAGVERVEHLDLCTSCRADLFFSHRRDGEATGRQAGVVVRTG